MREKFQGIFDRIQQCLEDGPKTNRQLKEKLGFEPGAYDQDLDRVLQLLRAEGKVAFVDRMWQLSDLVSCPLCKAQGRCTRKQAEQFEKRKK